MFYGRSSVSCFRSSTSKIFDASVVKFFSFLLSFSSSGLHIPNQPPDLFYLTDFPPARYALSQIRGSTLGLIPHLLPSKTLGDKSSSETCRRLMTNTNPSSQQEAEVSSSTSKSSADPGSIDEPSDEQARLLHAACVCQDWELTRRYVPSSWLFLPLLLEHACTTLRQARTKRYSFFAT
jgi:hypothetical protein